MRRARITRCTRCFLLTLNVQVVVLQGVSERTGHQERQTLGAVCAPVTVRVLTNVSTDRAGDRTVTVGGATLADVVR